MKAFDALLLLAAAAALLIGVLFTSYQTVYRKDILRGLRRANGRAVCARFGRRRRQRPPAGAAPGPWHVRLETRSEPLGRHGLVALREYIVLEDHFLERWRVTVETNLGGQTQFSAIALDPLGEAVRSAGRNAA